MHTDAVCAAKGQPRTPMPADKGIEILAFSGPLQFGGRRVHTTMVRHERHSVVWPRPASDSHDTAPRAVGFEPILGKTMPQSREGTPGEPANGHGRPVLPQQMHRSGSIAKGIEGPYGVFRRQRRNKSIGHGLPDQLPHALMAQRCNSAAAFRSVPCTRQAS
jgi:hypothetical protein